MCEGGNALQYKSLLGHIVFLMLASHKGKRVQQHQNLLTCRNVNHVCLKDNGEEQTSMCELAK
jgi:hypothetical protein